MIAVWIPACAGMTIMSGGGLEQKAECKCPVPSSVTSQCYASRLMPHASRLMPHAFRRTRSKKGAHNIVRALTLPQRVRERVLLTA